jgi:hypothetical protein
MRQLFVVKYVRGRLLEETGIKVYAEGTYAIVDARFEEVQDGQDRLQNRK